MVKRDDLIKLAEDQEPISHALAELPAYLRMNAVLRITGLSRATIYRRIACGLFPAPVHLGGRACGWLTTSLRAWIENPEKYRATPLGVGERTGSKDA